MEQDRCLTVSLARDLAAEQDRAAPRPLVAEPSKGRFFVFVGKLTFISAANPGGELLFPSDDSWAPGASRRNDSQPQLHIAGGRQLLGDHET